MSAPNRLAPLLLLLAAAAAAEDPAPARIGSVHFETSCAVSVRDDFDRAVALLHSFEYDEAADAFYAVADKDPRCAMAAWGVAMARYHGLWNEYNAVEGAKAVAEAVRRTVANPDVTPRERAYISAIGEIFSGATGAGAGEEDKRDARGYSQPPRAPQMKYRERMAALHEAYPSDDEATIFFALALDVTAARGDKTQADLRRCIALLDPLLVRLPDHPGVAHYIIHCSDNPEMAAGGLAAARQYARIAPASAHATHMPSHIFAELGLWDEMVDSNRASLKAAEADVHLSACDRVGHSLHAMYFLTLALAERGQVSAAREIVAQALKMPGTSACEAEPSLVLAGYVMETGEWERAREVKVQGHDGPVVEGIMWMTIGVGAARTGDTARAKAAEDRLAEMRDARAQRPGQTKENAIEALRLAVAAWIAHAAGQTEPALQMLRTGAALQDQLGSGNAIVETVREMLAEMLALAGRPKDARVEYEEVLRRHPHRLKATFGAATAAERTGDGEAATRYYGDLLAFAHGNERAELMTAHDRVHHASPPSTP